MLNIRVFLLIGFSKSSVIESVGQPEEFKFQNDGDSSVKLHKVRVDDGMNWETALQLEIKGVGLSSFYERKEKVV